MRAGQHNDRAETEKSERSQRASKPRLERRRHIGWGALRNAEGLRKALRSEDIGAKNGELALSQTKARAQNVSAASFWEGVAQTEPWPSPREESLRALERAGTLHGSTLDRGIDRSPVMQTAHWHGRQGAMLRARKESAEDLLQRRSRVSPESRACRHCIRMA
jgi:hypothetical protein